MSYVYRVTRTFVAQCSASTLPLYWTLGELVNQDTHCTNRAELCTKIRIFMKRIAILASGNGSNAQQIVSYLRQSGEAEVALIITNRPQAGVIERAKKLHIPCYYFTNEQLRDGAEPIALMKAQQIDLIVLAGYLCLITPIYIKEYPERIINIHPALLPNFGGKGMYGDHVHRAVLAAGKAQSGITIHLVDEDYDHGRHLLQATCPVLPTDTPETLASRIHELEHRFFPPTIAQYLRFL